MIIPLASLAAILVMVGLRLCNVKEFKHMFEIGVDQFLVFIVTIFFTIKTDLLIGVLSGVLMEILVNLIRGLSVGEFFTTNIKVIFRDNEEGVLIILRKGATFWNLFKIKQVLNSLPLNKNITIDFEKVKIIDHTLMEFLENFIDECKERNVICKLVGLDQFHAYSNHHSSARSHNVDDE
jgi:MFS superfamily sulfate permease-like transporter